MGKMTIISKPFQGIIGIGFLIHAVVIDFTLYLRDGKPFSLSMSGLSINWLPLTIIVIVLAVFGVYWDNKLAPKLKHKFSKSRNTK